jgi:hypothetical protein
VEKATMASGTKESWKEKVTIFGKTERSMKESLKTTKEKAVVNSHGPVVRCMRAIGREAKCMAMESWLKMA